ncbi:ABC transporter substrate-binding protein [Paenibacillus yanchengensis]|uniref:ABC transporter substrate-binding protein n=1 Tax=Paenibacillus yanchengensis TaxID=2035833 RepID=A0ABW4YG94_9BACL
MKNRKWLVSITATLVLAMLISACGAGEKTKEPETTTGEEKVTLQYYTWTDEAEYMKKVVDAFNAQHNDIQVNINTISNASEEYNTKMMLNLSSNSKVDVYSMNGPANLGLYTSKNQLLDLGDKIKEAGVEVGAYGPILQDITGKLTDDKYYALPYRTSSYALFYNKAIFDEAGLPYPTNLTWEQYAELAKKLTKGEGTNKQWGGYLADWITIPIATLQQGHTILDDNLDSLKDWLQFLDTIYYKDESHMSYKQMKAESSDWLKEFESGDVAMMINGEWAVNMLNADVAAGKTDVKYEMAMLPQPAGAADATSVGGLSTFMGINPGSKHQDAAFKFVAFATGEEGGKIIAEAGVLPAYANDITKEAFLKASGLEGSKAYFEAKTIIEDQPIPQIDQVKSVFKEQWELFLFGEQNAEKSVNEFMKQRDKLLEK